MTQLELLFEETFIKESISQFIRKVYLLLENQKYEDIIGWDTDNKTIAIKDCEKIKEEILPVCFKQKTLKSFIRQLNMYNFRKVTSSGPEDWLYFRNDKFVKGNLENLIFIKRKQRGYVQPDKLKNFQSRSILEKYQIYSTGILGKLKDQFTKIQDKFPVVSNDLINIIKNNVAPTSMSQLPTYVPYEPQYTHQERHQRFLYMDSIRQFRSFCNLPILCSSFSIPDKIEQ